MNKHRAGRIEAAYRLGALKTVFVLVRETRVINRPRLDQIELTMMFVTIDMGDATRLQDQFALTFTMDNFSLEANGGMRWARKLFKKKAREEGFNRLLPQVPSSLH